LLDNVGSGNVRAWSDSLTGVAEAKKMLILRRKTKRYKLVAMSPGRKAQATARWARIMTKWLVTHSHQNGAKWSIAEFNGVNGCESGGIVDLIAIRKDHRCKVPGFKRGDLFELVLIQTKGGFAARPTPVDMMRLSDVAKYHNAKAVVLVEWQREKKLLMYKLNKTRWEPTDPKAIFG
jgi:hypothetical protein